MIVSGYISEMLTPLRPGDTAGAALEWMHENGLEELPVVENNHVTGYARAEDLEGQDNSRKISDCIPKNHFAPVILQDQHLFDAITLLNNVHQSAIAVVNKDMEFLGIVENHRLISAFADFLAFRQNGAILVVELKTRNYSASEICRICEYNGARVYGLFPTETRDPDILQVQIRLNTGALRNVIATFERYGYTVTETYNQEDKPDEDDGRIRSIMKFLDL